MEAVCVDGLRLGRGGCLEAASDSRLVKAGVGDFNAAIDGALELASDDGLEASGLLGPAIGGSSEVARCNELGTARDVSS